MSATMELTTMQNRILSAVPRFDFIKLCDLAKTIDSYPLKVRKELKTLKALGRLSVGRSRLPGAPLVIRHCEKQAATGERPNFDKLLFNTRWV